MRAGLSVGLALALGLSASSTLSAQVLIDDFADPVVAVTIDDPPTVSSSTFDVGGMLGGERDGVISRESGAGTVSATLGASGAIFGVVAGDRGRLELSWDGVDADGALDESGLGGVDLTAGGANALQLTVDAASGTCEVVIEVFTDASNSSRAATTITAAGDVFFAFASFLTNLGAGANFASVGAIALDLEATGASSCTLSGLSAVVPGVTALKTDALLVDSDSDGEADPGETVSYTIDISATGDTTGVELVDTVAGDLTFVGGSTRVTPVAVNDSYVSVGNIQLAVAAGSGVLINDFDPDAALPSPPITAFDAVSLQGGTVALNTTDGSFTYDSPALFAGVDSFTYEVTDSHGLTDTALVNILVEGIIWFVDDTNTCPGDGSQGDPFCEFTANLGGAGGAGDVDSPGDLIFVFEGSGDTDTGDAAGFELEDDQTLHGEGVELVIGGNTIVPAGNNPTLTNSAGTPGHGITLAEGNTIRGLSVGATPASSSAFTAGADVGTLTVEDTDVSGAGGIFNVASGGTLAVTFDSVASTSSSGTAGINISGVTGSFTVANPGAGTDTSIAAADAGISIQNSSGANFSFGETSVVTDATGGDGVNLGGSSPSAGATFTFDDLSVTTLAGHGLLADSSGTLNVGGTASTSSATGGAAVDIDNMTIDNGAGGGGLTFASLGSTSSAVDGVSLNQVSGNFTVTGLTTVSGAADRGIELTNSGGTFTFGNLDVDNAGVAGVRASSMSGPVTFGGGSKAITNVVANTSIGVDLSSNSGATINFTNGGLDIDTTAGIGFRATGGGTLNVSGAGNTIDVAGMASHAVDLNGITIGASDVTFDSITGTNGIIAEGIDIDAVSNAGTFNGGAVTITGNGGDGIAIDGSSAAFNFTSADITSAAGSGINLTNANGVVTVSTVDIDGSGGAGVRVFNSSNAVNINGGTIGSSADNGVGLASVALDAAKANVTVAASITNTAGRAVEITSGGIGTFTFSGAIDEDGTGIRLVGNDVISNATINFRGGMALDTGGNVAFTATDGGIVEVCATNNCAGGGAVINTIGDATALSTTAINIQNTSLGANGATFQSVDVNGATVGIDIDGGGSAGFFTITGTGTTDGSGGTIQNITQNGILIENTDNITLNNLDLTNANSVDGGGAGSCDGTTFTGCNAALEFNNVDDIDIDNMFVDGAADHGIFANGISDFDISNSVVEDAGNDQFEHGIFLNELLGTASGGTGSTISGTTVQRSGTNNVQVRNTTATSTGNSANPDVMTISGSTIRNLTTAFGSNGVFVNSRNSGNMRLEVTTSSLTGNRGAGITANGDGGDLQLSVTTNNTIAPGGGNDQITGVSMGLSQDSVGTFTISNNTTINVEVGASGSPVGIAVAAAGTASFSGTIANNPNIGGASNVTGIRLIAESGSGSSGVADIDNNTIVSNVTGNLFNFGIQAAARDASSLDLTVRNNTITITGGTFPAAFFGSSGNSDGDSADLCVNFSSNTATGPGGNVYGLEQFNGTTYQLQGFVGDGTMESVVEAFVQGTDTGTPTVDAFPGGAPGVNFTAATCATP